MRGSLLSARYSGSLGSGRPVPIALHPGARGRWRRWSVTVAPASGLEEFWRSQGITLLSSRASGLAQTHYQGLMDGPSPGAQSRGTDPAQRKVGQ
jgi:hypothetical protein